MTECTTGYLFSLHQSGGVTLTRMFIRDIKDAILAVCVILLAIGLYLMERKLNEVIDTHSYTTNATSVSMAAVDARIHNLTRANDHTDAGLMRLIKRQDASGKWSQQQPQCDQKRGTQASRVAFTAELGQRLTKIKNNQPIIFDRVLVNYGQSYNNTSGIITIPRTGVYVFYWNTVPVKGNALLTEVTSARRRLGEGYADAHGTGGNLVLSTLDRGETVQLIKVSGGTFLQEGLSTFSGYLLYDFESE